MVAAASLISVIRYRRLSLISWISYRSQISVDFGLPQARSPEMSQLLPKLTVFGEAL